MMPCIIGCTPVSDESQLFLYADLLGICLPVHACILFRTRILVNALLAAREGVPSYDGRLLLRVSGQSIW